MEEASSSLSADACVLSSGGGDSGAFGCGGGGGGAGAWHAGVTSLQACGQLCTRSEMRALPDKPHPPVRHANPRHELHVKRSK